MLNQGSPWIGILIWIATRGKNMKRILLTTTSLVLAAGVAQADVSFSGTAGVALIDDNGARDAATAATAATTDDTSYGTDMFFESYYDFDVTASAESDNGVSVSLGFDIGGGSKIDYNDDDKVEAQGATATDADVTVGYAGWTLTVDNAGIDNLFDDDAGAQDVQLSGSIAGWSVAVTSDESASTSSYKVSGNVGGVALTLTGTDVKSVGGDASKIAASYAMGNGLTVTASVQDEDGVAEDENKLGFSYAMDAITVGYTAIKPGGVAGSDSFGDEWDFSVKYTAGPMVASFAIDEADATTIIADYALGGGASAFAAMHDKPGTAEDLTAVGLNFAF
jgi:outer membrane protein OmpU